MNQPTTTIYKRDNPLAIVSLVLGIMGFLLNCCFIGGGVILAVPALIFGFISLDQIKRSKGLESGEEYAWAGIYLSIIQIVLIVSFFVLFFCLYLFLILIGAASN